jgi:hypothetical protein
LGDPDAYIPDTNFAHRENSKRKKKKMKSKKLTIKANCQICKMPATFMRYLNTGWHVYVCTKHFNGTESPMGHGKKEDA